MKTTEFLSYHFVLPLYDIFKGLRIKRDFEALKDISSWKRDDVIALQQDKLKRLLLHAYETCPFYRRRFERSGIKPTDIKEVSDLRKLPPLRRKDIQEFYFEIISKEADITKCYKGSSSGSTGEPVSYIHDRRCSSAGMAALYFGWSLAGWQFGRPYLTIWGNPTCVKEDWGKVSSKIKSWTFKEVKVPAYTLTDEEHFQELFEIVREGGFDYIQGYTNAIYTFSSFLIDHNRRLPHVTGVLTTAENLLPHQRRVIEEELGPVYDFYGCGEINGVAFQCEARHGYHVMEPHVIVEYGDVIDNVGNRELLITDLDNYAMPLIRYSNGDMGIPGNDKRCPCGLPFSKIRSISGRISDVICTPEGGIFSVPSFLGTGLLKELKGLVRYQVELVEPLSVTINLHVNSEYNNEEESMIVKALTEYIPKSFKWDIKYCEAIKSEPNGKYKLFVDRTTNNEKFDV